MVEKPSFRVITDKGNSWVTSMAAHVKLEDAEKYFVGNQFNLGTDENEQSETVVKVEQIN